MNLYNYTAKDQDGKTFKGKVEARNEKQAANIIRGRNMVVISINQARDSMQFKSFDSLLNHISKDDLVQFTQQLSTMLNSGLPLTDSLDSLGAQGKPAMQKVLADMLQDIQGGGSLADAMGRHREMFSPVYIALVRAGEASGKLDEVLERLAETEEKRREFRQKTKGALIYPAIVVIAMVLVVTVLMIFVIPQLTDMYESFGADLPFSTKLLVGTSTFMVNYWWILLALLAGGVFLLVQWGRTTSGKRSIDKALLKIPIVGNLRSEIILTEFTRVLSLLVSAGISILDALEISAQAVNNMVYQEAIMNAARGVEKGLPLAAMLAKEQVFPPIMAQMIAVGEETGELEEVLNKTSRYFEQDAEHKVKNLTTTIEPLVMVVLGVVVAFIVFSVITPLYKLTELF